MALLDDKIKHYLSKDVKEIKDAYSKLLIFFFFPLYSYAVSSQL